MGLIVLSTNVPGSPAALEMSNGAYRIWVGSMFWASQFHTPHIPMSMAKQLCRKGWHRYLMELEQLGVIATSDDERHYDLFDEGKYWFVGERRREYIPADVRRTVYERDGYRCVSCLSPDLLSIDHIIPWSQGGSDNPDNLQTLCIPCNSKKGNRHHG